MADLEQLMAVQFEARGKAWLWHTELQGLPMKPSMLWALVRLPGCSLSASYTTIPFHPSLLRNVIFFSYGSASAGVKLKSATTSYATMMPSEQHPEQSLLLCHLPG